MRSLLITSIVILSFSVFSKTPGQNLPAAKRFRTFSNVILRTLPDSSAFPIGVIPPRQTLTAIEKQGPWIKVRFHGKEGWANTIVMNRVMDQPAPDLEFYALAADQGAGTYNYSFEIRNSGREPYTGKVILRLYAKDGRLLLTDKYTCETNPLLDGGAGVIRVKANEEAEKYEFSYNEGSKVGPLDTFVRATPAPIQVLQIAWGDRHQSRQAATSGVPGADASPHEKAEVTKTGQDELQTLNIIRERGHDINPSVLREVAKPQPRERQANQEPSQVGEKFLRYWYLAEVGNASENKVVALAWDYIFYDPQTKRELKRNSFVSKIVIKPGKKERVKVYTDAAPYGVVRAEALPQGDKSSEGVQIRRIVYADGSVWEMKALPTGGGS